MALEKPGESEFFSPTLWPSFLVSGVARSQNDWGPLDILILGALHVGLNVRPEGPRALVRIVGEGTARFWCIFEVINAHLVVSNATNLPRKSKPNRFRWAPFTDLQ